MQTAPIPAAPRVHAPDPTPRAAAATPAYAGYQIIRRNGAVVGFEPHKIAVALMKAFLAVHGTQGAASASVRETVDALTAQIAQGRIADGFVAAIGRCGDVMAQIAPADGSGHALPDRIYVL